MTWGARVGCAHRLPGLARTEAAPCPAPLPLLRRAAHTWRPRRRAGPTRGRLATKTRGAPWLKSFGARGLSVGCAPWLLPRHPLRALRGARAASPGLARRAALPRPGPRGGEAWRGPPVATRRPAPRVPADPTPLPTDAPRSAWRPFAGGARAGRTPPSDVRGPRPAKARRARLHNALPPGPAQVTCCCRWTATCLCSWLS